MKSNKTIKSFILYTLILPLLGLLVTSSHAEGSNEAHPYFKDKFIFDVGIFLPDRKVDIKVNGTARASNEEIDFEEHLRLDNSDETGALEFAWRFGEKWSLRTQYFNSSDSNETVLQNDIEWQDFVFSAGSRVAAGQKFSVIRVFVARSLKVSDRHEFGVGAGIHWLELGAFIEGDAIMGAMTSSFRRESVSVDGPLPNIGVWYDYLINPKWVLGGRVDWLEASMGDYAGGIVNAAIGANYRATDHFGVGLKYNYLDLDVDVQKPDWRGRLETRYRGFFVNMSWSW